VCVLMLTQFAVAAQPYIQQLNSFARVNVEQRTVDQMDASYLAQFGVILLGIISDVSGIMQIICALCHCSFVFMFTQIELFRINKICRSFDTNSQQQQSTVMFTSCSYGLEACFLADFGPKFVFHCDPPQNHTKKSLAFPSMETVLNTKWSLLGSRYYALPAGYLKFRFLQNYYT
jgi:hypothetical protein